MNILYLIDFNCPYSYIGLERLKNAVESLGLDTEWEMRSFELEPFAGKRPVMSTAERYSEKYDMSLDDAERKIAEIDEIGSNDGLNINYKDMLLVSSKNALRLAKHVDRNHPDMALELVEKIFESNLVENENINDVKILNEIALSCGLEEYESLKILENNYYNIEIELDKDEALSHGITATPCFILTKKEEKLIIPGVFSTEEFKTALKDFDEGNIKSKSYGIGSLNQY